MSGKHTPGPWFWEFCGTSGQWALRAGTGFVEVGGPPSQKPSADMRLIAAAPELLALVRRYLATCPGALRNAKDVARGRRPKLEDLADVDAAARSLLARIGGG